MYPHGMKLSVNDGGRKKKWDNEIEFGKSDGASRHEDVNTKRVPVMIS
jgi:hypothetical protein